jgi:hypothetical protein
MDSFLSRYYAEIQGCARLTKDARPKRKHESARCSPRSAGPTPAFIATRRVHEGLSPMVDSNKGSEGETRPCSFCNGTHRCHKCDGSRIRTVKKGWWPSTYSCQACEGTGLCQLCKGKKTPPRNPRS